MIDNFITSASSKSLSNPDLCSALFDVVFPAVKDSRHLLHAKGMAMVLHLIQILLHSEHSLRGLEILQRIDVLLHEPVSCEELWNARSDDVLWLKGLLELIEFEVITHRGASFRGLDEFVDDDYFSGGDDAKDAESSAPQCDENSAFSLELKTRVYAVTLSILHSTLLYTLVHHKNVISCHRALTLLRFTADKSTCSVSCPSRSASITFQPQHRVCVIFFLFFLGR